MTAALELDNADDPTTGSGTITIKAASITTNSDMRDGHLKGADFLDVEKYPDITFTLKSIVPEGDHFKVTGDLTIKDVTHELTLDYEHSGSVQDPFGNTKVGGTLTGTMTRGDWGLNWNVPLGSGGLLVEREGEARDRRRAHPGQACRSTAGSGRCRGDRVAFATEVHDDG